MNTKHDLKKITYLSAIVISVGTTIGAGIFFKNNSILKNSGGDLTISIMSWLVAAIGILAIGLSLAQLSNNEKKTDGGILAWTRDFAAPKFHKFSRGFMLWLYFPVTFLAMPIYSVQTLQDTYHLNLNWWQIGLIAFAIALTIASITGFSPKNGERLQWVFMISNFVPILLTVILGFAHTGDAGDYSNIQTSATNMTHHLAFLGIFASLPAIFFSYDGFYMASSLKSSLKDPKKELPKVMIASVIIITVIYLSIAIALFVSSPDGTYTEMKVSKGFITAIGTGILLATLGILNGFCLGASRMYKEFINDSEMRGHLTIKKYFPKRPGVAASLLLLVLQFIIFVPVGGLIYFNDGGYDYSSGSASNLYSIIDLLTNWTSLIAFFIIACAILGSIIKYKRAKQFKTMPMWFKVSAYISVIFVFLATGYMLIDSVWDLIAMAQNGDSVLGPVIKLITLGLSIGLPILLDWGIPAIASNHRDEKLIIKKA